MWTDLRGFGAWLIVPMLSVVTIAAPPPDVRLVQAARTRDIVAVRALLGQHVNVDTPQADGATALHWAAHWNDLEMIDALVAASANANVANEYGISPLFLACENGTDNAPAVERLLKAGANPNAARPTGETPLMMAARSGSLKAVKLLLDSGASVNTKDARREQTPLMWAVAEHHVDVVQELLQHGADVKARSKGGYTPLLFAAQQGDQEVARVLLAAGADINETASDGSSVLLVATMSGLQLTEDSDPAARRNLAGRVPPHESLAVFLLDKGANPNLADTAGATPLLAAARYARLDLVKVLLAHGANPNSAYTKNPRNALDLTGATPYLMAAVATDAKVMRALVDARADPLATLPDSTNALMLVAGLHTLRLGDEETGTDRQAIEAAMLAMELGCDPKAINDVGRTALHGAADLGRDGVVQLLIEKGAPVDLADYNEDTPYSFTIRANHLSTQALLRKHGANPNVTLHCDQRLGNCS